MNYTAATTQHLLGTDKRIEYRFELRLNQEPSTDWKEYAVHDFQLVRDAHAPAVLRVELVNGLLSFSAENSTANRTQLLAEARLTGVVNGESKVLFQGRVQRVEPVDQRFSVTCYDWLALVNECDCEINLAPEETDELAAPRQVTLAGDGKFGGVYGFTYAGTGDFAFNTGADPGTRRRAWAPGDIRLYYDAAGTEEVPALHYQVNLTGGTVTILEDTSGNSYYVGGVRCYIEGTLDWAAVFQAAFRWPVVDGGIGAGETDLDMPDTGLDLAGPLNYRGRVGDLLRRVQEEQQANLRLWYDAAAGRYKLRLVEQAARGEEHWELCCPVSIAQPRDIAGVFSRVVVHGRRERPRNALTEDGCLVSDLTTAGDWFAWDGLNVGGDSSFAAVVPLLSDGDCNLGAAVHNLVASEGGGTDKYNSWYGFIQVDFGVESRLDRVRVTMPGSRNVNAVAGHQGLFWPGVRIYGSLDGVRWRLVSPRLCGRYKPNEIIDVTAGDLLMRRARYLQVQLGAYKHGFENQSDPSIGLAELEVYTDEEYEVVKEVQATDETAVYEYTDGKEWCSYHPGLLARLGGRQRTRHLDVTGVVNEYLAHDYALDQLAESIRLFQQVAYVSVGDPRVGLYDTVAAADGMNGDLAGFLVERMEISRGGTRVMGTDYLGGELGQEE